MCLHFALIIVFRPKYHLILNVSDSSISYNADCYIFITKYIVNNNKLRVWQTIGKYFFNGDTFELSHLLRDRLLLGNVTANCVSMAVFCLIHLRFETANSV